MDGFASAKRVSERRKLPLIASEIYKKAHNLFRELRQQHRSLSRSDTLQLYRHFNSIERTQNNEHDNHCRWCNE